MSDTIKLTDDIKSLVKVAVPDPVAGDNRFLQLIEKLVEEVNKLKEAASNETP